MNEYELKYENAIRYTTSSWWYICGVILIKKNDFGSLICPGRVSFQLLDFSVMHRNLCALGLAEGGGGGGWFFTGSPILQSS